MVTDLKIEDDLTRAGLNNPSHSLVQSKGYPSVGIKVQKNDDSIGNGQWPDNQRQNTPLNGPLNSHLIIFSSEEFSVHIFSVAWMSLTEVGVA